MIYTLFMLYDFKVQWDRIRKMYTQNSKWRPKSNMAAVNMK